MSSVQKPHSELRDAIAVGRPDLLPLMDGLIKQYAVARAEISYLKTHMETCPQADLVEQLEAKERERIDWHETAVVERDRADGLLEQLEAAQQEASDMRRAAAGMSADLTHFAQENAHLEEQLEAAREALRQIELGGCSGGPEAFVLSEIAHEALNPAREPLNFGGIEAMTNPLSAPGFGASAIPSAASPEGNDGEPGAESSPAKRTMTSILDGSTRTIGESNQDSERHGPDGLRKNPSVGLPGKAPVPGAGAQNTGKEPRDG